MGKYDLIVFKCQEVPGYLDTLADQIKKEKGKQAYLLLDYPVVYLHVWKDKYDVFNNTYHIYVGEADNAVRRQGEHWAAAVDDKHTENWQHLMANAKDVYGNPVIPTLYIIGNELFQKSMTLDIENRLINYCIAMSSAVLVNGRFNPQRKYYGDEETLPVFGRLWRELRKNDPNLFMNESVIKKSALYKASPNHILTNDQKAAKERIISRVLDALINKKEEQLVLVEGEAGTGKTVLTSSTFYDLLSQAYEDSMIDTSALSAYLLVNHDEQLNVYASMTSQLGYGSIVFKPQEFINSHEPDHSVDIIFVDEAHLLMKKGRMGMKPEQLKAITDRAKVVVLMFDRYQILRKQQYVEPDYISDLIERAKAQGNYIPMTNQLRMNCATTTMEWIDSITKKKEITKLSKDSKGYEIKVFDTPEELQKAIKDKVEKAKALDDITMKSAKDSKKLEEYQKQKADELSRLIATYDWPYSDDKKVRPASPQEYWEVQIPHDGKTWTLPWNYELINNDPAFKGLSRSEKMRLKAQDWAEQEHTINEVGSIFTVQGFDLAYAGLIIGPSVSYDPIEKKVKINPKLKCDDTMKGKITLPDGSKKDVGEFLGLNEFRVLMTRGSKGLYIYACDDELRKKIKDSIND